MYHKYRTAQFTCIRALSIALAFALSLTHAYAAEENNGSEDPPDRVARLAYLQGAVSLQPAGVDDWADASLNRPLTTGDKLWVDRNSRAALQTGSSNIHVDQGSGISLLELSDKVLQMRVTEGAINLNVQRLNDAEVVEIDTPTAAITVTQPGEYHIEISDDGSHTLVKAYRGECEVAGGNRTTRLLAHQQADFSNDSDAVLRQAFAPRDDFDAWARGRNLAEERSASARYVAPDVIGYSDLDEQGDWVGDSDYGNVWYPTTVAADWSPYRFGHWAWVAPWGWTWVDDASWGFAPFHYGRWAFVRNRWGWVPGPTRVRAVYAPALVAWVGTPVGAPLVSVSVTSGGIGWFPLGPREMYVPGYRCSEQHMQNVNIANTVIINRTLINNAYVNRATHIDYAYRTNPRAVTVVQRDTFVAARAVGKHMIPVPERDLRNLHTENISPSIAPERASTLGPHWNANAPSASHWKERTVVVRHAPPPRTSFTAEQRAIRDNNNRPVVTRELRRDEPTRPNDIRPNNVRHMDGHAGAQPEVQRTAPPPVTRTPSAQENREIQEQRQRNRNVVPPRLEPTPRQQENTRRRENENVQQRESRPEPRLQVSPNPGPAVRMPAPSVPERRFQAPAPEPNRAPIREIPRAVPPAPTPRPQVVAPPPRPAPQPSPPASPKAEPDHRAGQRDRNERER